MLAISNRLPVIHMPSYISQEYLFHDSTGHRDEANWSVVCRDLLSPLHQKTVSQWYSVSGFGFHAFECSHCYCTSLTNAHGANKIPTAQWVSYCKNFLRHLMFVLNMSKAMVPCLNSRKLGENERHLSEVDRLTVSFELFGGKRSKKNSLISVQLCLK